MGKGIKEKAERVPRREGVSSEREGEERVGKR